jgi:hypothetical protein
VSAHPIPAITNVLDRSVAAPVQISDESRRLVGVLGAALDAAYFALSGSEAARAALIKSESMRR